jgi:hypothetical protein
MAGLQKGCCRNQKGKLKKGIKKAGITRLFIHLYRLSVTVPIATVFFGFGDIYAKGTTLEIGTIQGSDCGFGCFIGFHIHETEATGKTGYTVADDTDGLNRSVFCK